MATVAPSPLASSVEKTNGAKLSRLLIDGGTTVLRKIFDGHHPPANLITDLNANYSILNNLLRRRVLNRQQWRKLFPSGGVAPDSNTFDITLLFLLLTKICGLTPPPSGWHTKPPSSDTSHEANLARVKFYRNVLYGHVTTTGVDTPTFSALWTEISGVLVSLGLDQAEVDRLKAEKGGEQDYIDVLIEWADSEEDIKSQLKNIHQSQSKTHQAVEDVLEAQVKTQKTVENIHQTQASTQKTVEDVHQTQASTQKRVEDIHLTQASTQKTVENIHQTQANTQKTVEDVRYTQDKTQRSVEEVCQHLKEVEAGLKELKETVGCLKEGKDKDRAEEVLRNLSKSEFRGDIEYYVELFQEGTREWVFDRVQNWLDDRRNQNRVMVISGNAGMGKSVIAAVICKRMQKAARLSGSHFCQYNNVRYCKPQLMIQSLACHLSRALPEYKHTLVEQLSRNWGTDLNNMGVEELFSLLLKEPLSAVGDPGRNMLMVIDGLDESECQGRNELLDVIANQFCKLPIWIRFFVTTRPALNIAEKLKHLKPLELNSDGEENLKDVRVFCEKRLQHVVKLAIVDEFVERLVLKSEGLTLYAHFFLLSITAHANVSIFHEGDLSGCLPIGISSVYHSYFKRLERELLEELDIKEENFLNLLSAMTASREPLPVGFVSEVLVPGIDSPIATRKVLRALSSVSALLPIRDDCLHVIHKSVKDWLTDVSYYGEHEFIMDENQGHRVLVPLCTDELDNLKRKGVHNIQFSATQRYALYHGTHHMLHEGVSIEPHELDKQTDAYILDLEIVYAKTCLNSTLVAEDLVWLKKHGIFTLLSKNNQSIIDILLFLLRKYLLRFTDSPRYFFETVLNQGGKLLTVQASYLLQNKYPEIAYMELVHKETLQEGIVAEFKCSSDVVCLDVSPKLDYMVCECDDGNLQLVSLQTGRLVWTRPVVVEKTYVDRYPYHKRNLSSGDFFLLFRSVVFHPTKICVLPGTLSQAYSLNGDLKPLFPVCNCRFSVCSISGDKTKILTNCMESDKCLVLWSLENGSEVDRILEDEDILSFAWSGDGTLLAISHSSRVISLVDVISGFRKLTQIDMLVLCGALRFSPDRRFLFCADKSEVFCLKVDVGSLNTSSREVSYDVKNSASFSDCGFLFGDLIPTDKSFFNFPTFVLDEQRQLLCFYNVIEMWNTKEVSKSDQGTAATAIGIALSLDGQTVYVATYESVTAYDVFNEDLKAEIILEFTFSRPLCTVREGVVISTKESTVEFWDYDLSKCIKMWTNLPGIEQLIPVSDERVAVVLECEVNVLDTNSGEIVSTIPVFEGKVLTCNSKCQLLTFNNFTSSLWLLDGTTVIWKKEDMYVLSGKRDGVVFSRMEQFLVVKTAEGLTALDAKTGNTLRTLQISFFCRYSIRCTFISDDTCVIAGSCIPVSLFNVKSGEFLSVIDVESEVTCLAACPLSRVLVIGLFNSTHNFKVIRLLLPRGEDSEKGER